MDNHTILEVHLDPLQGYFTMVLFIMWSVYFGLLATTYIGWFNYDIVTSIFVHFAVILPIMITNLTSQRSRTKW